MIALWLGCRTPSVDGSSKPTSGETGTPGATTGATGSTGSTGSTGVTGVTGDTSAPSVGPDLVFDDAHVLVIPDAEGLRTVDASGQITFFSSWYTLLDGCIDCGGEGSSADGDGLLVSFTQLGFANSGVARVDADFQLDWKVVGFSFAHDAIRDPNDQAVIVPEAFADRVTWIPGDGSSNVAVRTLGTGTDGFEGDDPNGADRFDFDGRSYLLVSHRGDAFDPDGAVTLWDITFPGLFVPMWRYPETGELDIPHGPLLRWFDGQWWLVYAHTEGAVDGSTIGVAVTSDPTVRPTYVADLTPPDRQALAYVRGVELTSDGWLWITDSGPLGSPSSGTVWKAPMPAGLAPQGGSGGAGPDQRYVPLASLEPVVEQLSNPFEGWLRELPP